MSDRVVLIDDHLLIELLVGRVPAELAPSLDGLLTRPIYTAGYWYYRACRALTAAAHEGALAGRLGTLSHADQLEVVRLVCVLPPTIAIIPLRDLVPLMAELSHRHGLNLLAAEVLAAAQYVGADLYVAAQNDGAPLRDAAASEGVSYTVLGV